MILGIVGSRRRNSKEDYLSLCWKIAELEHENNSLVEKIVTGDCDEGGDKFARKIADETDGIELDVKYKRDPETGERVKPPINRCVKQQRYDYWTFTGICYARNEEIAKEPLDYLIALVAFDRKGGTENTIRHFRRLHKDWKDKLVII